MKIYTIIILLLIVFLVILELSGFVDEKKIERFKDVIYRKRPTGYTSPMSNTFIDNSPQDIIRNYRKPVGSSKITNEIDYYQMNKIVQSLKNDATYFELNDKIYKLDEIQFSMISKKDWNTDQYYNYVLSKVKYHFVLQLNINSKRFKYDDSKYPIDLFHIINTDVVRWFYNQELGYFKILLNIEIYRQNKTNSFILYTEVGFKPDKDIFHIYDSKIVGTRNQDQIGFNKLYNDYNDKSPELPLKQHDFSDYRLDNDDTVSSFKVIEKQRAEDNVQRKKEEMYKCFHPGIAGQIYEGSKDKNDCESYHENLGSVAVWDRPCLTDDECPFYQANKNYPNNRGGCIKDNESGTGFCELPVGMNLIGYRRYGKELPYCYNCGEDKDENCRGVECSRCCAKQRSKIDAGGKGNREGDREGDREGEGIGEGKKGESQIESPDFIFENDKNERLQYREELLKKGLSPIGLFN